MNCNLHNARPTRIRWVLCPYNVRDNAELRRVDVRSRIIEVRVIEHVECIASKLRIDFFTEEEKVF